MYVKVWDVKKFNAQVQVPAHNNILIVFPGDFRRFAASFLFRGCINDLINGSYHGLIVLSTVHRLAVSSAGQARTATRSIPMRSCELIGTQRPLSLGPLWLGFFRLGPFRLGPFRLGLCGGKVRALSLVAQQARLLALPVALGFVLALVVQLLALRQRQPAASPGRGR